MSNTPNPIFILGTARSGTTWLGNILVTNPQIVGAHHWLHWGIAESRLREIAVYAGDISGVDRLTYFLEVFASSDYFRLLGGDKDHLYRYAPRNFFDLFFEMMDRSAEEYGAPYWVTKLDPQFYYRPKELAEFLRQLDARYTSTRFVSVERNFEGVLRSYLSMEGTESVHRLSGLRRAGAIAVESGRYVSHSRGIKGLLAERGGLSLTFEELVGQLDATLGRLGDYLEIEFSRADFEGRYPPNSSHSMRGVGTTSTPQGLSIASSTFYGFFRLLPFIAKGVVKFRDATRRKRPPFYWRLQQFETAPELLLSELQRTGQTNLLAEVNKHLDDSS